MEIFTRKSKQDKPETKKQRSGNLAEQFASDYLKEQKLRIIDKNFLCKAGEIDIIALDPQANTLVFIEVRFRKNSHFGSALESVTYKKQQKIIRAAHYFLALNKQLQKHACRFDVVALENSDNKEKKAYQANKACYKVEWIKDAFYA
jgi:putative endonuclease